ncbi:MAG: hypothetical protein QXP97_07675 [Desulfurococcus sp.]|uniref:hypothetical protein n=1 Tax=Desulfurococcus sp. TaxID=51678 RepID=UPI003161F6F6
MGSQTEIPEFMRPKRDRIPVMVVLSRDLYERLLAYAIEKGYLTKTGKPRLSAAVEDLLSTALGGGG